MGALGTDKRPLELELVVWERGCEGKPVPALSLDLVDGDVKGSVRSLAHRQGLVNPKLGRRHRLTLREGGQVKSKLLPVGTGLQQVPLMLHCTDRRTDTVTFIVWISPLKEIQKVLLCIKA